MQNKKPTVVLNAEKVPKGQEHLRKNTFLPTFKDENEALKFSKDLADSFVSLFGDNEKTEKYKKEETKMLVNAIALLVSASEKVRIKNIIFCFQNPEFVKYYLRFVTMKSVYEYWTTEVPRFMKRSGVSDLLWHFYANVALVIGEDEIQNFCKNKQEDLSFPPEYTKLKSLPEDPAGSVSYGKKTPNANCFVMVLPLNKSKAMPLDEGKVIAGVRSSLSDDQGLVAVVSGKTKNQSPYIYSIIKTRLQPSGMQYVSTMHIFGRDKITQVQVFCDETGVTGQRDAIILNQKLSSGEVTAPGLSGWAADPYDKEYKKGALMNLSEDEQYDAKFPDHPLSQSRMLIKHIVDNN